LDEEQLYQWLFPEYKAASEPERPLPGFTYIQKELKKKGVTLRLLWDEYKDQHLDNHPYTQFCAVYRQSGVRNRPIHIFSIPAEKSRGGLRFSLDTLRQARGPHSILYYALHG
jgi:hypothetical protein